MADGTNIEWTDATWNPITGCQVKSPGCKFCYAMKLAGTRLKHHPSRDGLTVDTKNGPVWTGEVRFNEAWLTQPLHWTKPRMIFVCAHADLFYEGVPCSWIDRVNGVMALGHSHIMQVLTKRPDNMADYYAGLWFGRVHNLVDELKPSALWNGSAFEVKARLGRAEPLKNVWLGCSVEDQAHANQRRESMRRLSKMGWKTWVSYEPALGPVDWSGWEFLDWMVSGGESDSDGHSARPHHPGWHRATRDFGAAHSIPYLFKQWGAHRPLTREEHSQACGAVLVGNDVYDRDAYVLRVGKKQAGRLLDGRTHDGFPAVTA